MRIARIGRLKRGAHACIALSSGQAAHADTGFRSRANSCRECTPSHLLRCNATSGSNSVHAHPWAVGSRATILRSCVMYRATPTDEWPCYWPLICGHGTARGSVIYVATAFCIITLSFTCGGHLYEVCLRKPSIWFVAALILSI